MVAGAIFGLTASACLFAAVNNDFSDQAAIISLLCFVLGGTMLGLALGLKFNPAVSEYWRWLIYSLLFVSCAFGGLFQDRGRPSPEPGLLSGVNILLIPAVIATAIAVIINSIFQYSHYINGVKTDASRFSIATMMLVLGGASVAFGLLRWINAPAVFFSIVAVFILGRFASLFITAISCKQRPPEPEESQVSEKPPGKDPFEEAP